MSGYEDIQYPTCKCGSSHFKFGSCDAYYEGRLAFSSWLVLDKGKLTIVPCSNEPFDKQRFKLWAISHFDKWVTQRNWLWNCMRCKLIITAGTLGNTTELWEDLSKYVTSCIVDCEVVSDVRI